uniref:Uncharacterized protein n=1 Tax=Cacopsylla melanoneura TaxID=428564 RepID=A0A8D8RWK6_9HEMI
MKLNQEPIKQDVKKSEYAFNIKQLPDFQLLEIHERQAKILKNKFLLNKLPDKGAKLIAKNEAIETELELRKKTTDDIITCISELKIEDPSQTKDSVKDAENAQGLNCADKSLSSSCSSLSHEGSNTGTLAACCAVDKFAVSRSSRLDAIPAQERFIPAQCAKTKTGPPCAQAKSSKQYTEKDLSAACTPGGKYDVKQVSLTDVVKLKGRETTYLKELEIKEAQDRLSSLEFGVSASTTLMKPLSTTPMNYRSRSSDNEHDEESHEELSEEEVEECIDEDEQDRRGTISYTIQE